jgi:hypothetical protein
MREKRREKERKKREKREKKGEKKGEKGLSYFEGGKLVNNNYRKRKRPAGSSTPRTFL